MRLRKVKHAREIIDAHPETVVINPSDYKGKWKLLFNNENPIHLEIGMGKGKFIIEKALNNPDINFIGIEKYDSVIVRACEKLINNPLPNVLLINDDAANIINFFENGEIHHIYLNFSDPWPKKRHIKRRLTNPTYLKLYQDILAKNGCLEIKTDNQKLFEYTVKEVNNFPLKIEEISLDLHKSEYNETNITTEYEERFKQLNKPIYSLQARF